MTAALAPSADRFVVRLASAADPAELKAWLDGAAPGARAQYASGIDLPRDTAGVKLVQGWIAAKLVNPFQRRDPHDARRTQYWIERSGAKAVEAAAARPRARAVTPETQRELRDLLRMLRDHAARGRPCPSRRDIARHVRCGAGETGRRRARYLIELLAERGSIRVEQAEGGRVITILAPGRAQGSSTSRGGEQQ